MNKRANQVLNGLVHLSDEERNWVLTEIGKYLKLVDRNEIVRFKEGLEKRSWVASGPVGDGCTCCGRS